MSRHTSTRRTSTRRLALAVSSALPAVLGFAVASSSAQTNLFWDGDGASPQAGGAGTWNTSTVHFSTTSGGTVDQIWNNANGDSATFDTAAGVANLAGPITVNTITTAIGGFTIGNGNGVGGGANTLTLTGASAGVNAQHTTGTTTLTALISGTFNKLGPGRVEVNNTSNPNTSKWVLKAGALTAPNSSRYGTAPGALVSDFFTFDGGGMGFNTVTTGIDLGANRGVTLGAGGGFLSVTTNSVLVTISGPIVGTAGGDLTITGGGVFTGSGHNAGGVWTLSNTNNSFDGDVFISGTTGSALRLGVSGVVPDTAVVNLTASGNQFDLATNGVTETVKSIAGTAGTIALGAAGKLTVANPSGESYSSVISGTAGSQFIKNGTGTLTLSGGSSGFSGEFVINAGKIGVGGTGIFGSSATGTGPKLTINGGILANTATNGRTMNANLDVDLSGDFTVDDSLVSGPGQILFGGDNTIRLSNRTITVDGTANLGFATPIGEDVAGRTLTKAGTGVLVFQNATASGYTGQTTVLAGRLQVDADGQVGPAQINLSGGALNASASRTAVLANDINVTADSAITTTSAATDVNFEFTSNNIGGTGGTLTFRNDGANAASDQFQPRFSGSGFDFARPIVIDNGATGTTNLRSFNASTTTQTFSGDISGTGSYRRSSSIEGDSGDTILSGNNSFAGGVALADGGIGIGSNTALGSGTLSIEPNGNSASTRLFASGAARSVTNPMVWTGIATAPLIINGSNDLTLGGTLDLGAADRTIQVDNTGATEIGGVVSNGGIIKTGVATLTLSAVNTYTGATSVNGGTLIMTQGLKSGGALTVETGADAVIAPTTPDTFDPGNNIVPAGTNAAGSIVNSLTINGSGQLDLNNNDMIVEHDGSLDITDIRDLIASGYNFGGHDGPGIISSTAVNTDPFTFTLGYADNASLPIPYGTTIGLGTLFAGFDPDDTAALIKFTWVGDVTLDGVFDFQDLSIFNGNYDAGATTGRVWTDGDLNYDGTIDFQDLSLFNGTYDPGKPSLPEPAAGAFLAAAAALGLRRRRRGMSGK